jgi:hypothetical protein
MSTSPDEIVNLLSRWLARHVGDGELRDQVAAIGTNGLSGDQAEAVDELLVALRADAPRGELEVAVRETLEALALG